MSDAIGAIILGVLLSLVIVGGKVMDERQARKDMSGPLFIAHGCEGAGGDLWATDITDFPTSCKEIERAQP